MGTSVKKMRQGCLITYAKYHRDPPSGLAAISRKLMGVHPPPPARMRFRAKDRSPVKGFFTLGKGKSAVRDWCKFILSMHKICRNDGDGPIDFKCESPITRLRTAAVVRTLISCRKSCPLSHFFPCQFTGIEPPAPDNVGFRRGNRSDGNLTRLF